MKIKQSYKKEIINSLLDVPSKGKRNFWGREIKFLNELYELFPNVDFWLKLTFEKKYDSLLFLKGNFGMSILKKRFLEFNYKPRKVDHINISDKKYGDNFIKTKQPKTIKDFLKNE